MTSFERIAALRVDISSHTRTRASGSRLDSLWNGVIMLFIIVERFKDNDMLPVYRRVREGGRMIPEGLKYVDS